MKKWKSPEVAELNISETATLGCWWYSALHHKYMHCQSKPICWSDAVQCNKPPQGADIVESES